MAKKLSKVLDNLSHNELIDMYNLMWKEGNGFTDEEIREHIRGYIIMFYKMASYKESCKEKCYFLIKELQYHRNGE